MSSVQTLPAPTARASWPLRLSLLAISFLLLTYYAIHHGSYSLVDRQTIALFLWVAIGVAAVFGVLPAVKPPKVLLAGLVVLALLAGWTLLSLTWTESAERTFNEFARIIGYAGVLVLIWLGVGCTTWRLIAAGLLAASALVSCLVVLSRLWPGAFPVDTVALKFEVTRINYPFGYWNAVGCWCAMTSTLCLAYAAHARSGLVRALSLAVVPVCAVGLYLALSRAGFGGALLGAAVVVVLAQWRWLALIQSALAFGASALVVLVVRDQTGIVDATGTEGAGTIVGVLVGAGFFLGAVAWAGSWLSLGERLKMPRSYGRPLGFAASVCVVIVAVLLASAYGGRAYDEFTGKKVVAVGTSNDARLAQLNGNRHNLWDSAWDAFTGNQLKGIGPGTFEFWWSRNGSNSEFVRDAHNIYLEALTETGVIGAGLLLLFFALVIAAALWSRRSLAERSPPAVGVHAGLVGVFTVFAFQAALDWMWESTAVAVFALAAIAVAGAAGSSRREVGAGASLSLSALIAAVLAVIVLLPGLAAERQVEKSQAAVRTGDDAAALRHANSAIDAEPWSATAWGQRALVLEDQGQLGAALVAIRQAEKKEPYNWRWPLIAARIQVKRGNAKAAAEQFDRARELRPYLRIFGGESPAIR